MEDFPDVEPNQAAWLIEGEINYIKNLNRELDETSISTYYLSNENYLDGTLKMDGEDLSQEFTSFMNQISTEESINAELVRIADVSTILIPLPE